MTQIGTDYRFLAEAEDYDKLRAALRKLCEAEIAPRAAETDRCAEFPVDCHDALRACDFHAPRISPRYGGAGADALATAIIVEEVARVCATSSLIPAINTLCTVTLETAASERIKSSCLPKIARSGAMASFCLSEPQAGSDVASITTRARRSGEDYILTGVKRWITHAGLADFYLVFAVTDPAAGSQGISAFLVEKEDSGVSFGRPERKLGIKGSPTCEVYLDDVRIPVWRMIGVPGAGMRIALRALDHSRITIGAQAVGIGQGALDCALAYTGQRQQFGQPVAAFQGVQFMLADMAARLEAARSLVYTAAAKSQRDDLSLTYFASAAKCFASDTAMAVTTDAVQLLGAYGFSEDYPVARMMRDAKITQIYEGTNQIQRVVMARALMEGRHG
jgi:alkylation response protein AidB-like acyl-CoA dehydrogenase